MAFDPLIYTDEYLRVRAVPTKHTSTYIFIHGPGQKGGDWQFVVEPLRKLGHVDHVAFIFPYLDFENIKNEAGMLEAAKLIQRIVAEEIVKGVAVERIAVGGFMEGFDVALLSALADDTKIAAIVGVTEGLRSAETIRGHRKTANARTPVFVIDRSKDNSDGGGKKLLAGMGQPIGAWVYENSSAESGIEPISPQEIEKLGAFLREALPVGPVEKN